MSQEKTQGEKCKCKICQENKKKGEVFRENVFVCKKCLKKYDITEDGQPDFVYGVISSRIVGVNYRTTAFCRETGETIELYPDPNRREIRREIR